MKIGPEVLYKGLVGRVGIVESSSLDDLSKGDSFHPEEFFKGIPKPWEDYSIFRVWHQLVTGNEMMSLEGSISTHHPQFKYVMKIYDKSDGIFPKELATIDFPPCSDN